MSTCFDIHREPRNISPSASATHYCLGSALARLEGRTALEEILKRFPEMGGRPQLRRLVSDVHRAWMGGLCRRFSVESNTSEEMTVTMTGSSRRQGRVITGACPWPGPRACGCGWPRRAADIIAVDICKQIETVSIPAFYTRGPGRDRRPRQGPQPPHLHRRRSTCATNAALKAARRHGRGTSSVGLDIIVANAGIGNGGQTLDKTSEKDWTDMIDVNTVSACGRR